MGPPESPTAHPENQEGRRRRLPCRPRMRRCLLKGCEQRFHPRQARQRYCNERCGRGRAEMVTSKSPREISAAGGRTTTPQQSKPTLPGAGLLLKALENGYRCQFVRAQDLFDE